MNDRKVILIEGEGDISRHLAEVIRNRESGYAVVDDMAETQKIIDHFSQTRQQEIASLEGVKPSKKHKRCIYREVKNTLHNSIVISWVCDCGKRLK